MAKSKEIHTAEDMERIRRGLEDFLNSQLEQEEENPEDTEDAKRDDIVRQVTEEYDEDWDLPKRRRSSEMKKSSGHDTRQRGKQQRRNQQEARTEDSDRNGRRNASKKSPQKEPRRKSRFRKFLITAAVLAVVVLGGLYYVVGTIYAKMEYTPVDSVQGQPLKSDGVINILLIGNDSRDNSDDGRSDAMILLSVSREAKTITMTSLLRDMYVEIPGHDNNRLNAAYSFGGAELLMETVEKNLDIEVNRYVLVNFEAFANLVDAVGGIDLELTKEEIEYVNGYLVEYNILTDRPQGTDNMDASAGGLVHLNGPQALAYSRNRYLGTDFGRTERQRKVLTEVIHKIPKAMLTNPSELLNGLLPNLTTNLTQWECYTTALGAPSYLGYDIRQASIPIAGTYQNATIRGMAVLEVDFAANRQYLKELLQGQTDPVNGEN